MESGRTLLNITHPASRKSSGHYLPPIHVQSWPKVKSGKVVVCLNIAQNNSSSLLEVISDHNLPQFTWKVDHLGSRKSYLVIIIPTWYEMMTKSVIRSSWSQVEHCSKSLIWPLGSHIWSLFAPIHMKSLQKVKSGKVVVSSNIAQNNSSSLLEVISGHNLPQFTWKVDQKWN